MRKPVAAVTQPVNVPQALQRRSGPVSHAKQLISVPPWSLSSTLTNDCTVIMHVRGSL